MLEWIELGPYTLYETEPGSDVFSVPGSEIPRTRQQIDRTADINQWKIKTGTQEFGIKDRSKS